MIQFFINNIEIILPDNTEVSTVEENPLITRNGEFSMDITTSLLEGKNAIAFKHINRLNQSSIQMEGPARMILNGKTKNGKYTVLKVSDIDVTWQFLSGNSELNFIAKSSKKIWEYNWGSEAEINYTLALRSINYPGYGTKRTTKPPSVWTQNYVCAPIKIGDIIANDFLLNNQAGNFAINAISGKIIIQPYLLYYINKLPELLGYTLSANVLNSDDRAKIIYLTNSIETLNYADFLPDMTVSEFISEIENIFNVVFLVDAKTKTISIDNIESNINSKTVIKLDNKLDTYVRDFNSDSLSLKINFTKLQYNTTDSIYFKYHQLSDEILQKCKFIEFENLESLLDYIDFLPGLDNKLAIYRDIETNYDYFTRGNTTNPGISLYSKHQGLWFVSLVNKFAAYKISDENELTLKSSPASFTTSEKVANITWPDNYTQGVKIAYQLPICSNSLYVFEEQGFIDSVENSIKNQPRSSILEICLFTGKMTACNTALPPYEFPIEIKYPFSHVDTMPEMYIAEATAENFEDWIENYYKILATKSLRLIGVNGIIDDYKHKKIVDTSQLYTFSSPDKTNINSSNFYEIDNQIYVPIKFERQNNRSKTLVTGYFYRKI